MTCANRTKGFKLVEGFAYGVGLTPTSAELWGGGTYPTVDTRYVTETVAPPSETPEYYENIETTGDVSKNKDYLTAIPSEGATNSLNYAQSMGFFLYHGLGAVDYSGPHADGSLNFHMFEIDGNGRDQCSYTSAEAALATANVGLSPAYDSGDIKNRDFTRLLSMGPADYKQANCRINNFVISGTQKEPLKIEAGFVSEIVEYDESKTESSAWTLTDSDFLNPMQLRNTSAFQVQDVETGIFDFNYTTEWDIDVDRYPTGTANTGLSRAEPFTNSAKVNVQFTVEKHDSLTWENYRDNATTVKIKHELTVGTTGFLGLYFPEVQIKTVEIDPTGGSRIAITAEAHHVTGADPFSTERTHDGGTVTRLYDTPMYAILKNGKAINYGRQS
jgi:hypothetical protein